MDVPGSKNFRVITETIADGEEHTFYECLPKAASGIFEPNQQWLSRLGLPTEVIQKRRVTTKTLDAVIPQSARIDLIKMDIQGAELLALKNGSRVLKDVSFVQCEADLTELFLGGAKFPEIYSFMESQGFAFHTFTSLGLFSLDGVKRTIGLGTPTFSHPHFWSRQLAWSISLFYRKELAPDRIINAAAIAHTSFKAYDLARSILMTHSGQLPTGLLDDYESTLKRARLLPE